MASPAVQQGKVEGYPCHECGGPTTLAAGTEALACDHCGAKAPIVAGGAIPTYDLFGKVAIASLRASEITSGGREVQCKQCGARSILSRHAARCAFCDAPMVAEPVAGSASIPPGGVLPFIVDKKTAAAGFAKWMKGRWFAPGDLVKRAETDKLDGVYLPYWTFDAQTTTDYDGERGDAYYDTETYTDSEGKQQTRQVRKISWSSTSGTVHVPFHDVLVCATPTLPTKLVQKLEPWDLPELRPFDGRFLAGFVAERYRVEASDGFTAAYDRIEPGIRSAIRRDIGGDEQRISSMNVSWDSVGFRHLLLPLWLSAFRYNDKVYRVTVNARTGEVQGERPWSALKIILFVLMIIGATAALVILLTHH